jgi:hypothetical protein
MQQSVCRSDGCELWNIKTCGPGQASPYLILVLVPLLFRKQITQTGLLPFRPAFDLWVCAGAVSGMPCLFFCFFRLSLSRKTIQSGCREGVQASQGQSSLGRRRSIAKFGAHATAGLFRCAGLLCSDRSNSAGWLRTGRAVSRMCLRTPSFGRSRPT